MKLSAPPPPPPEPPAPGEPPAPDNSNPTPATPELPPEAPPPPALADAPALRWPHWYPNVDGALAALALVFAFASASFVARNSDLWLNLAAGKRLFAGEYIPGGSDPFSYTAADRTWVNHNWLYDAGAYLLYGGKGVVLTVAKSVALVLAFALLIAIRRPQFPLWPWAATACVAVLAASPHFTLRPLVASILLLAVTMYLLFRLPQKSDSWRFPIAIGVTFWLWAQLDQWFFVGPLALALLLLGDFIQTKMLNSPEEPPKEGVEEPLGRLPDTATLLKALGVGVLACTLTPHHVRVWELPIELTKPAFADADPRMRSLLFGVHTSFYRESPGFGYNLNGASFVVLFLAGSVLLGFGPARTRASHIALFVGFAALAFISMYAIPLFAVVAVPLIAAQLNAFSARAELKSWGDPKSRLLYLGSSGGRIVSLLLLIGLCVAAYPGWVHPESGYQPYARRFGWGVEPDPTLVAAAEQFGQWRASGKLPPDTRGFVANLELANYLAWHAPGEKVFVNSRYAHHARELPDYVTVRKGLQLIDAKDEEQTRGDANAVIGPDAVAVLKRAKVEYVVIHAGVADGGIASDRAERMAVRMHCRPGEFVPWYVDGRTSVFGWNSGAPNDALAALRVDPVRLAFGPDVRPAADLAPDLPPPELGWEEAFVRPPKPGPAAAPEAIGWWQYKQGVAWRNQNRQVVRERLVIPWFLGAPATAGTAHRFVIDALGGLGAYPPFRPNAETDVGPTGIAADAAARRAAPILALRAARRAIADAPDHPDGYYALYRALGDSDLPLSEGERALGRVAALRQCLDRMPKPDRYKRGQYLAPAFNVALALAAAYLGEQIPGPPDPRTKQPTTRGFIGVPIDVFPLNGILGQMVFENPRSAQEPLTRLSFAAVQQRYPANLRPLSPTPFFLPLDEALEVMSLALEYYPLDVGGELSEEGRKQLGQLEAMRKEVETALARANTESGYARAKAQNAKLPILVEEARGVGLAGTAYKLLTDKDTDLAKAYQEREGWAAMLRVALELGLGKVEYAHASLTQLEKPESAAALAKMGLAPDIRTLKYHKALLAGEYKLAGELQGEGMQVGVDPILAAVAEAKLTAQDILKGPPIGHPPWPLVTHERMLVACAQNIAFERSVIATSARDQMARKLADDSGYFYQRGVLSVLEGDMTAAKRWFGQTTREPPPGWGLSRVAHADAARYLELIAQAEKAGR